MRKNLTSYLNRIEEKYKEARNEWNALQKALRDEDARYQGIDWSKYSYEGQTEEFIRHEEKKKEILKGLERIRDDFEQHVEGVVAESDRVFDRYYKLTPSDVDQNGVFILQNANLTDKELVDMAENYRKNGNNTMYFMIADRIKADTAEMRRYKNEAESRRKNREDHGLLYGFRDICAKGLRDEDYLSNGIDDMHSDFYQKYKAVTDDIEVVIDDVG